MMKKNFTAEEILKKHETNIKSATSSFVLAGVLGIIYFVRHMITKNFNFFFSFSFTELMLRSADSDKLTDTVSVCAAGLYTVIFIIIAICVAKNPKHLKYALIFYGFDCLCLVPLAAFHGQSITPDFFIDVIIHLFVMLFVIVGIRSQKKKGEISS